MLRALGLRSPRAQELEGHAHHTWLHFIVAYYVLALLALLEKSEIGVLIINSLPLPPPLSVPKGGITSGQALSSKLSLGNLCPHILIKGICREFKVKELSGWHVI